MQSSEISVDGYGLNSIDVAQKGSLNQNPGTLISPRETFETSPRDGTLQSLDSSNSTLVNGNMYPEWKQQVILTKEARKRKEVQKLREEDEYRRLEEERMKSIPQWKRELMAKKQIKELTSEEDIYKRQRVILTLEKEISNDATPPWQQELLKKRKERLEEELKLIEDSRSKAIEKQRTLMSGPTHLYER